MKLVPKLRSFHFSTDELPPEQRFDAWHDILFPFTEVREFGPCSKKDFKASIELYDVCGLLVGQVSHTICQFTRTIASIAASPVDHIQLSIPLEGSGEATSLAANRPYVNEPKSAGILDLHQPISTYAASMNRIVVYLPRASAEEMLPGDPARIHGQVVTSPASCLLSSVIGTLFQNIGKCDAADLREFLEILIGNIIRDSYSSASGDWSRAYNLGIQQKIRRYIHDNITSETPTPEDIARKFNVSLRVLYSLFESYGGVATYIRVTKLRKIHQHLNDPSEIKPIKTIVARYGFHDEQHFSRLFRAYFKYTARSVRRHPLMPLGKPKHTQIPSYGDFLLGGRDYDVSSITCTSGTHHELDTRP